MGREGIHHVPLGLTEDSVNTLAGVGGGVVFNGVYRDVNLQTLGNLLLPLTMF